MMKNKLWIILWLLPAALHAQTKSTATVQQVWTGYFNQSRFSQKWGAWLDVQLRTKEDFFTEFSQLLIRPGITYYVNDATKLTAGYAYIRHFPADNHSRVAQPEHRPWQQLQWHTRYGKNRTMQWVRLEERYRRKILNESTLGKGYSFNFRLRYNFLWQIPLTKGDIGKGDFSLILNDEAHVNFGKQVVYNYFDQNRFFAGFAYHLNAHDNLQLGYLNVFQQLSAGNRYRATHAARIFYFHNLDLRHNPCSALRPPSAQEIPPAQRTRTGN
jgi:hypothetical protein